MDTTQVSVFCVKFLRSFGNLISSSAPKIYCKNYGSTWDKAISGDNRKAIKDWVQETELLGTVGVNSMVGGTALGDTRELHVFCNAWLEATAAVAYIKKKRNEETLTCFFLW